MKIISCKNIILALVVLTLLSCNSKNHFEKLNENNTTPAYKDFLLKSEINVPVYPLTKGPEYHWFAYYDKFQTDPTDRFVLSMQVNIGKRSPNPRDEVKIGMIDLYNDGKWIELGSSRAWNWQQGCMLQWLPGSKDEIIWNDLLDDRFVCHILNIKTMKKRTIDSPIYTISPDGKFALTLDFERVQDVRAGYGYAGLQDANKELLAPVNAGVYKVSLENGSRQLIVPMKEIADISYPLENLNKYKHYFNHIDIAPNGKRFAFLHRWVNPNEKTARISPLGTRFITASTNGGAIHVINDSRMTSHFCWKNEKQILAWANRPEKGNHFYLFDDALKQKYKVIGKDILKTDGHCRYLKNQDWLINDTYPDENRQIELYLFNTKSNQKIVIGKFYSDPEYSGEWRVDLHPRQTRDGNNIIIDCTVGKSGRQMLLLDISELKL